MGQDDQSLRDGKGDSSAMVLGDERQRQVCRP
jgi:hypothetical protein